MIDFLGFLSCAISFAYIGWSLRGEHEKAKRKNKP